ncbi:peroxidase family protein [Colletotrichum tofieldiae]|uniref:Peroxidase family protein n=1 Tax=Colletotrichum tofieldiae TaxID=708197 RepID=A0A161VYC7_9PEZI|nr:peroxidase family protein [Colletotrichum tofieldiae]GKT65541.1 peroxidase family protein [Colletotrichum tofieldiae]GKT71269.1 peroxidase family protein [Colletotrichum tofieldiae]GKT93812.1 peroxidase family protein [Colletotrichum tofieldiae]
MTTAASVITMEKGGDGIAGQSHYTIVRETTNLDRMFYVYHRLGIQSNVLVSARYASAQPGNQRLVLSDEAVFSALHAVVAKYPELGLVGVVEPAGDKRHLLSLASLNTVDLDSCVEFINEEQDIDAELLENLHGQWHWADGEVQPGQPWWKIIVVGRRDVIFVFHHLVCDGAFGMTFHREFLAALNDAAMSKLNSMPSHKIQLSVGRVRLSKRLDDTIHKKPSMLGVMYNLFVFLFYRFFYAKKLFFTNFPKPKALLTDPMAVAQPADRTATKVVTCRIPAEKAKAIIAACRLHGATFTPFLAVLIAGTLATDFYPDAEVGFTRYAVDMRATGCFETSSEDEGKLLNLAASLPEPEWLKKYRRAFPKSSVQGEKQQALAALVDAKAVWTLIQDYGRRMKESCAGGEDSHLYKSWISGNALGPSLEEFAAKLPTMGLFMQNSFSVSNVGALKTVPQDSNVEEPVVKIEDVQFSAGPVQGAVGYHGIVFNVAGVAGGDIVINACTEKNMAPDGMPEAVLDAFLTRVDALLQHGGPY